MVAPEHSNLSDAKEIAIDLETRDEKIKELGPVGLLEKGTLLVAVAVEVGKVTFL